MLRKIISVGVNNVLVYVLGMVYTLLSARLLGPGQRGILVVAVLVPTWVATLSQLGLPQALIYNLSRSEKNAQALREALAVCLRFLLFAAFFIFTAFAIMTKTPILRGMTANLVTGSLLLSACLVLEGMTINMLTGLQNFRWSNRVTLTRPLLIAAALLTCWKTHVTLSPLLIVQVMTFAALCGFLLGIGYIFKTYRPRLGFELPGGWRQSYLAYGLKLYIATLAQALNYRLDTLIVQAQLGSKEVGLYSVGVGASELLLFVPVSVAFVFYPKIASAPDESRNRMTLLTLGVSLYVVLLGGIALELLLPTLLPWAFGTPFAASVAAAQWLIPGMLALTVVRILSYASAGIGKPEYATYTMLVGVLGTVPLDFLLIPKFGIVGAAMASLIAYSGSAVTVLTLYMRLRKISVLEAINGMVLEPLRWLIATLKARSLSKSPTPAPASDSPLTLLGEFESIALQTALVPAVWKETAPLSRPSLAPQKLSGRKALLQKNAPTRRYVFAPKAIIRWAFFLFILVIPFDTVNFPSEDFALTKTVGLLFMLVALVCDPRNCFRRPPKAFWYFALYVGIYILQGFSQDANYFDAVFSRSLTLVQLLGLFWISYNLMRFPRIANGAWVAFVTGCVALAVLQVTHIGGTTFDAVPSEGMARTTSMGANANQLCGVLALGALAVLGLTFGRETSVLRPRWISLGALALLAAGMISTVSRGGLLAMAIGMSMFLLSRGSSRLQWRNRIFVVLALSVFLIAIFSTDFVKARFEQALVQGNLAKREYLYPAAWSMFQEKPLTGWGPISNRYELGRRTYWAYHKESPDTHNMFLYLATESGVLGLFPYLLFGWYCLRGAWRARDGYQGIQPFAMVATLLMLNTSGTWVYYKLTYLVLAYSLASAGQRGLSRQRGKQSNFSLQLQDLPQVKLEGKQHSHGY